MKNFLMAATALGGVVLFAGNALAASEYRVPELCPEPG